MGTMRTYSLLHSSLLYMLRNLKAGRGFINDFRILLYIKVNVKKEILFQKKSRKNVKCWGMKLERTRNQF